MHTSWRTLHASLRRSVGALAFHRRFERIRNADPALGRFRDPAALLDALHARPEPVVGDTILAALIRVAQSDQPEGDAAVTLVLLALWPGLDAMRRRLQPHFAARGDDLTSEISARMVEGVRTMCLDRVGRIAATLIRNAERDTRRALAARWAEAAVTVPLEADEDRMKPSMTAPVMGAATEPDPDHAAQLLCERMRRQIGDDADLVAAVAIEGHSQSEAAALLGLGQDAARKRYQRALHRLRADLRVVA
jgi:RNA polymerase sigma-70 factor (ECF subfamily)